MKRLNFMLCWITMLSLAYLLAAPSLFGKELGVVVYSRPQSATDTRILDVIELLRKALQDTVETDGPFTMRPTKGVMNISRAIQRLKAGKYPNVVWTTVTKEREQEMFPIRIPIRKGLLGYRIFLIRKQDREKFAAIKTLDELKRLRVGQGHTWKDVKVFKANGFKIITAPHYEGLFEMLIRGRFDYYSRGINEAPPEYEARKDKLPDLFVEEKLLLYYPWPKYFYVVKNNSKLAERIERGLNRMIQDGSFDKHFFKYNQHKIDKAKLKGRRIFKISNPLLPPTAPLDRKELWYDPFGLTGAF